MFYLLIVWHIESGQYLLWSGSTKPTVESVNLKMRLFSTVAIAFSHPVIGSPARGAKECVTKDGEYFGTDIRLSVTKSGKKCRNWADVRPPLKSVDQFDQDHNYCRYVNLIETQI